MRCLFKAQLEAGAGNHAIREGLLPKLIANTIETLKPEASYFYAEDGKRTACFYFDLKDPSKIPVIVEPWFMTANAAVSIIPAMNHSDLEKGIKEAAKSFE